MMARWLTPRVREFGLAAVGVVALACAILATFDLLNALRQAEALYSVGMTGLSIESDLQGYTQESRRVFVYALTTKDPNIQLPYVNAAHTADQEVGQRYDALAKVDLNPVTRSALTLVKADWKKYLEVRDQIVGLILEDRSDLALEEEKAAGAPRFEHCARSLQELKRLLDRYAREQLVAVQATYYRCAIEVGLLIVAIILSIGAMKMLAGLRKKNLELTEAELQERQRSRILEWISQNAALPQVLAAVAELVNQRFPERIAQIVLHAREIMGSAHGTVPENCILSWSGPITTFCSQVVGSLNLYCDQQETLLPSDLRFLERTLQLVMLAVEHRRVTDQLAFQAQYDALTGLANRATLGARLDLAIAQATAENKISVLWIDLDRFKQVNDIHGHQAGDAVLREIAKRLKRCTSEKDLVARIGGDEFIVLLSESDDVSALKIAQRLLSSINQTVFAMELELSVGASIGISTYPLHGDIADTLLKNADTAMYSAKFGGKNAVRTYEARMGTESGELLNIDKELRTAVDRDQFEIHYQPQVSGSGAIHSAEALLRWQSPALGSVSPALFIPVAEANGAITAIGTWVLRKACFQGAQWHRLGHKTMRVAVNVSFQQFMGNGIVSIVEEALADSGLPAQFLELELTETAVMRNPADTAKQIAELRDLGVTFAIDDFGTGSSSLSYLRQLTVDCVKIDRSFVDGIDCPGTDALPLIRAIVGLAHGLDLTVVAEGVETREQQAVLTREGCDLSQGYFHHRPMTAESLTTLLGELRLSNDLLRLTRIVDAASARDEAPVQ